MTTVVKINGEEIAILKTKSYKHSPEPIDGAGECPKLGASGVAEVRFVDTGAKQNEGKNG